MVRALLDGSKTQTRRVVKPQPPASTYTVGTYHHPDPRPHFWAWTNSPIRPECANLSKWCQPCPYGQPGDQLWVRETFFAWGRWETRFSAKKGRDEWHFVDMTLECGKAYEYPASGGQPQPMGGKRHRGGITPTWCKRPAIHMPRLASRITLEISEVRVERLNSISEADAQAEGAERRDPNWPIPTEPERGTYLAGFEQIWTTINGAGSWEENPWVWIVMFRRAA